MGHWVYLDLRSQKETKEKCIRRTFITCNLHKIWCSTLKNEISIHGTEEKAFKTVCQLRETVLQALCTAGRIISESISQPHTLGLSSPGIGSCEYTSEAVCSFKSVKFCDYLRYYLLNNSIKRKPAGHNSIFKFPFHTTPSIHYKRLCVSPEFDYFYSYVYLQTGYI
jgi:hypothetical protein